MIKNLVLFLFGVVFIIGCGSSGVDIESSLSNVSVKELSKTYDDIGLSYLNSYRELAGLSQFSINESLKIVAQDHASYQVENNLYTHDQSGKTLSQRAVEAGFDYSSDLSENIYAGDVSPEYSIDILFSNIYHRLAFLDLGFDVIGLGMAQSDEYSYKKVYTYEMGRENSREENQNKNPKIVLWPYKDQQNVMPVFYEELPDPLPECSVSGYPISLQFNPVKNGVITIKRFIVKDSKNIVIDSEILENDSHLSSTEFVLMPLSRLKWGETYHVEVSYNDDDKENYFEWSFKTKELPKPYFIVKDDDESFNLKSGQTYYFYFPPKDCNDSFKTYTYRYNAGLKIEEKMIDHNTIMFKIIGSGKVEIKTENSKKIELNVN